MTRASGAELKLTARPSTVPTGGGGWLLALKALKL